MINKVAIITGVSGGLAHEIVLTMLRAKFNVAAINRNTDFDYSEFTQEAQNNDVKFSIYKADLKSEGEISKATQQIIIDYGKVNVLIHLAGISFSGMSWKQSAEDWQEVLSVNLTGPMLLSKHVIPHMKKQNNGVIIYFSSIVAHRPIAGTSAYAASKSALEALTKTQAIELGNSNIRVNCIAPGYIDAGMIREINDSVRNELLQSSPIKSLGNPKSIAETVLYLCGTGGEFTTGQTLHINGGLYI
jgi:3-oxoacyl-[acyl-carrier protein] reductase